MADEQTQELSEMAWITPIALYRPIPMDGETRLGFGGAVEALSSDGVYYIFVVSDQYALIDTEAEYVIVEACEFSFTAQDGTVLFFSGDYIDGKPLYQNSKGTVQLRFSLEYGAWVFYRGAAERLPRARTKFGDSNVWVGDAWYQGAAINRLNKAGTLLNETEEEEDNTGGSTDVSTEGSGEDSSGTSTEDGTGAGSESGEESGDGSGDGTSGDPACDMKLTAHCPRWEKKADSGEGFAGVYEPKDGAENTLVVGEPYFQYETGAGARKWRWVNGRLVEQGNRHMTVSCTLSDTLSGYAIYNMVDDENHPNAFYFSEFMPTISKPATFEVYDRNENGEPEKVSGIEPLQFNYMGVDETVTKRVAFICTEAVTLL